MKRFLKSTQGAVVAIGALALVVAAAGGAWAASGGGSGKITVCVSKNGGALYQAKKCQKKDKKLSWNAQGAQGPAGPAGKNGTDGKNGTNGANGAVQGYSATQSGSLDITDDHSFTTVISKQLPAGSYIVSGSAVFFAIDSSSSPQAAEDACRLKAGSAESTEAFWSSPLGNIFLFHLAEATVPMEMALTIGAPTTVALQCEDVLTAPPGTFTTEVEGATITAIQTTSNS
jgi:hypothetical protein